MHSKKLEKNEHAILISQHKKTMLSSISNINLTKSGIRHQMPEAMHLN